jgi:alginate O-acetyltransferase complex protein AlgI
MLFNTVEFIVFFAVVLALIVIIKNRKYQHIFLLASSYFFFYFSSNYLVVLLFSSALLDFYIAKEIWKSKNILHKKLLLIISLAGNLGLLGFFKYADFAIMQFNILGNYFDLSNEITLLNLALPIGISFYTFQTIGYTVDVYRNQLQPSKSFREFALYVSFFPQLVAGPIIRAKDFLPQLREKIENVNSKQILRKIIIDNSNFKLGITIMAFGFFKKIFFADNLAPFVNEIFNYPMGLDSFAIITATLAFGIQIYADFSGYSDIAIGAALILGFKIPKNFNKPYFAISPTDFWKRWHISLSSWLKDYLYIPLGGNKKSSTRTYTNLIIVMFLGGLWHGASWNFVVWGLLHGFYLAIHKLLKNKVGTPKFFQNKFGKIIAILITQYFVFLAWIPFRVHDTEFMLYSIQKYIFIDFDIFDAIEFIQFNKFTFGIIGLFFILQLFSYRKPLFVLSISKLKLRYWTIVLTVLFMAVIFFSGAQSSDFIYFRF